MPYRNAICSNDPSSIRDLFSGNRTAFWMGALSFEERCTSSFSKLLQEGLQLNKVLLLNYPTQVKPYDEDKRRREFNFNEFENASKGICKGKIEKRTVDPYAFQEVQNIVEDIMINVRPNIMIFDITCMTKIHTLALAAAISRIKGQIPWVLAYTVPDNYANTSNAIRPTGWRDIIVAPLAETGQLFNEAHGRGLIILGHESDRLIVGLAELEPAGGVLLLANTPNRPDLRSVSRIANKKTIRQLTNLPVSKWSRQDVVINDIKHLAKIVEQEIILARNHKAPVILFPFGPKSLVFFSAMQLCAHYAESSWFVYPVPTMYNVNYTEGVDEVLWFRPT